MALGAVLVEKHFTLRRADGGPDAAFSLEPDELRSLVETCRTAAEALGKATFERAASEAGNVQYRRSLYVVEDIPEGGVLSDRNVRSIRPGYGMAAKHLPDVLGRRAACTLKRGTPLSFDHIAGPEA